MFFHEQHVQLSMAAGPSSLASNLPLIGLNLREIYGENTIKSQGYYMKW